MAEFSYPSMGSKDRVDWESMGLVMAPDRIVSGLGVSVVGTNVVRLAAGMATVGGWTYENTTNLDFTVSSSPSNPREDRLVLRKTWNAGTNAIQVRAALSPGVASPAPVLAALPSGRGPGATWDAPVAQWSVTAGSAVVQNLSTNGRGPGSAAWVQTAAIPINAVTGWNLAYGPSGPGCHAPQPVRWTVNGKRLPIVVGGIYAVSYSVRMVGANSTSWIRLELPWGELQSGFTQAWAHLQGTGWMEPGESIYPSVFQDTGSPKDADLTLSVARST